MAKTSSEATASEDSTVEIDLKDPRLAAFLAWLIPGAGHIYQGRTGKGVLFFVCILGTFFYGLYIGDGRVVYASTGRCSHGSSSIAGNTFARSVWACQRCRRSCNAID